MNKSVMLESLVQHYAKGNKAQFALLIGVTPQLISNWLRRNTFDAEILFANCPEINAEWLLSGEGPMIKDNKQIDNQVKDTELVSLCKSLVINYQQRDEVMGKLVSMVKGME